MKVEHIGLQVEDPVQMCEWYCLHLGFQVKRKQDTPPFTMFIADSDNSLMLEIHRHEEVPICIPDYRNMDPLLLHLAYEVGEESVKDVAKRLIAAGATSAKPLVVTAAGDELWMLRDPWGLPIQLTKRAQPMTQSNSHA